MAKHALWNLSGVHWTALAICPMAIEQAASDDNAQMNVGRQQLVSNGYFHLVTHSGIVHDGFVRCRASNVSDGSENFVM
jgi:hypothetical protein